MKVKLISVKDEAVGTKSFFWQPEEKVKFLPGQYFYYTLPKLNYPDDRGDTRHFTIASSPTEEYLQLTTRIREQSGYKKTLAELPVGTEIEGQGPEGTFILSEEKSSPQVYIAGGIGITPFRTMLKYAIDSNFKTPFYLIYSNSGGDIVYKKEFDEWIKIYPNLKIQYFDSEAMGHLSDEVIKKFLTGWSLNQDDCTFWVSGPSKFVSAMEDLLEKLKVSQDKIETDKFNGY